MSNTDTIAAVATPLGTGGIGVVRVSGPAVPAITHALLGVHLAPRYATYSKFCDQRGNVLDKGIALYFPQPNSFTGEHVLELHGHGSPVVLNLLLQRLFQLGARTARPGEFSERAFHNNKLDLVQAEAIADLIASRSEVAARAALRSLEGEFSCKVNLLLNSIVRLRVYIEAAIDFPEEEIDFLAAPELLSDLIVVQQQMGNLLAETQRGAQLRDGLHVVIAGRPNVGKSSLLNALTQTDRAIITPIPGTTRDILRENVQIDGIALTLVDTAGLREASDLVEQEGIRRAYDELDSADVILLVTDSISLDQDRSLLEKISTKAKTIILHNKIDLTNETARCEQQNESHLWLSVQTGEGLELLREELKSLAGYGDGSEGAFSARIRHVQALEQVALQLDAARHALQIEHAGELAAEELRIAQDKLGSITGKFVADDLLGEIFSSFCIGK